MRSSDRGSGTVVFVTDFGLQDGYAAELWAAAWAAAPGVRCVDGSHLVPPYDVLTGAYLCGRLARSFGAGSTLCVVVDPGVGGPREAVATLCDGVAGVAPDTGLLSYLWMEARERRAVRLPAPDPASATFHGRDLFAPVAARLAMGAALEECGVPIREPRLRAELIPVSAPGSLQSVVVAVDRFGNCVTGVRRSHLAGGEPAALAWKGGRATGVVRTYAEMEGGLNLLWNSGGHLELAARQASAAEISGLRSGSRVTLELA
jgi:S-adenosylmethionine hydrolase